MRISDWSSYVCSSDLGAVGDGAEQAVQGGAGGGQVVEQGLVDAEGGECLDGGADAFGHAFGGPAGGGGQGDARGRVAGLPCLGDQEDQHAGDGGGLAGVGATGDEEEGVVAGGVGGLGVGGLLGGSKIRVTIKGALIQIGRPSGRERVCQKGV